MTVNNSYSPRIEKDFTVLGRRGREEEKISVDPLSVEKWPNSKLKKGENLWIEGQ